MCIYRSSYVCMDVHVWTQMCTLSTLKGPLQAITWWYHSCSTHIRAQPCRLIVYSTHTWTARKEEKLPDRYHCALVCVYFLLHSSISQNQKVGAIGARHCEHVALLTFVCCDNARSENPEFLVCACGLSCLLVRHVKFRPLHSSPEECVLRAPKSFVFEMWGWFRALGYRSCFMCHSECSCMLVLLQRSQCVPNERIYYQKGTNEDLSGMTRVSSQFPGHLLQMTLCARSCHPSMCTAPYPPIHNQWHIRCVWKSRQSLEAS